MHRPQVSSERVQETHEKIKSPLSRFSSEAVDSSAYSGTYDYDDDYDDDDRLYLDNLYDTHDAL
jgi:hypothetical protein